MPQIGVLTMKLIKTLTLAALVAAAPISVLAQEVGFGSEKCLNEKSSCVIFLGPMTAEELALAGININDLVAANELIDLTGLAEIPPYVWFARN